MPASRSRSASSTFWFMPAQFGGHVADQRGGAAAALGGKEAEALAAAPWRRVAPPAAFHASAAPAPCCSGSCSGGYRYSLMPARREARMASGLGGGVERDDHRVAGGVADGGDQTFQRLLPAADIHQHHVRPHALQPVQEIAHIAHVLVFDDDAERQVGQACLRLVPEFAVFDCQSDGQRIHVVSPRSPVHLSAPPLAGVGVRPGFTGGAAAGTGNSWIGGIGPVEPPGLPCAAGSTAPPAWIPTAASPAPVRSYPCPAAHLDDRCSWAGTAPDTSVPGPSARRESAAPFPA